jgi:hypothetical protein
MVGEVYCCKPRPRPILMVYPLWNFACGGQRGFLTCV